MLHPLKEACRMSQLGYSLVPARDSPEVRTCAPNETHDERVDARRKYSARRKCEHAAGGFASLTQGFLSGDAIY